MAPGSTRTDAARVLLVGGSLFLLTFVILTTAVVGQHLESADLLAQSLVQQSRHPWLHGFMEGASFLGGQPGQIAIVLIGSLLLWPRRRRWAVGLPLVMAGVGVVQLLAKWAIDRPRPNLESWGFPSAHVLSLVVLCGYFAYVVGMPSGRRRWRIASVGTGVGVVGTVAYSRMYLDAHWLSDILGGLTAGLAYLCIAIWLIATLRATPFADATDGVLAPAIAGPSTDPLVAAAVSAAMAPAAPAADAS